MDTLYWTARPSFSYGVLLRSVLFCLTSISLLLPKKEGNKNMTMTLPPCPALQQESDTQEEEVKKPYVPQHKNEISPLNEDIKAG